MKIALLISTYNWPEALNVVLKSLKEQTVLPHELLIADDGSNEETTNLIEKYKGEFATKVKHIWQEDNGFRKSAVLNKAIAATDAAYIIQIDGDCILHSHFIKDHLAGAKKDCYLFGSRVNIKPEAVATVLKGGKCKFSIFSSDIKNKSRNFRVRIFRDMYKGQDKFSSKTRGCNISYWRKDFIDVNGYDETMEGWGREDSEFVLRMLNNGVKGKRLRYGGIVYHIYHPGTSKSRLEENTRIQSETIREGKTWCTNGVNKYFIPEDL